LLSYIYYFALLCSERWVLHSTANYARGIIAQTGLQKPSSATLTKVAEELFQEFQSIGLNIPRPFFMKAHRWLVLRLMPYIFIIITSICGIS
jgi:predicted NAD/FAD-dependent oxidoreductase